MEKSNPFFPVTGWVVKRETGIKIKEKADTVDYREPDFGK
jgi:hypothetical protein